MGVHEAEPNAGADVGWLVRRGAIAALGSVTVNLAIATAALAAGIGTDLRAMSYASVGVLTVVGVIGAVAVYALLARVREDPDMWFTIVAAAALVLTLIPDFTYIPTEPGGSLAAGLTLAAMHVMTAVICVVVLTGRLPADV